MKRVKDKITAMLNAITFAEANEPDAAIKFLNSDCSQVEDMDRAEEERLGVYRNSQPPVDPFEKSMSAAAFAEAGEFGVAREILNPESKPHTVLLVIERDSPNANAIEYTVNLCKRIGAIMDVLITPPPTSIKKNTENASNWSPDAGKILELTQLLKYKEVTFHMYMLQGDFVEKLGDYVRSHKEVTTVVYDSPRIEETHSKDDTWHKVLDTICTRLSIPLITVFDKRQMKLAT
jgi:hypothetical protein